MRWVIVMFPPVYQPLRRAIRVPEGPVFGGLSPRLYSITEHYKGQLRSQSFSIPMPFRNGRLLCCAVLIACGKSSPDSAESSPPRRTGTVSARRVEPVAVAGSSTMTSPCPRTGQWALCSVEKRLLQSGFVVRRATPPGPRRPGFSVLPTVYTLGKSRLEVFVYADEGALQRDVAKIDTLSASPIGAP